MRGVKTKSKLVRKKFGVFLVLLLVLLVLTNSVRKVYKKKIDSEKALVKMDADIKTMEDRKKYLASSIKRLSTTEGIKFEIRKKLNVAEAGESVAIIVNREETASSTPKAESSWQKIKGFFKGIF